MNELRHGVSSAHLHVNQQLEVEEAIGFLVTKADLQPLPNAVKELPKRKINWEITDGIQISS